MISLVNQYTSSQSSLNIGLIVRTPAFSWFKRLTMPAEQSRIFLFLDLNNSTAIAEKMGNVKYSMFLSRIFKDFKACVNRTKGKIYQYVGDEVVVSWPCSQYNIEESILLVTEFYQLLNTHSNRYKNEFNYIPSFKAALHQGMVAVTRMGTRKVYRGDVLNTCARMLDLASQFKIAFVTSQPIAESLIGQKNYCLNELENVAIRGKAQRMRIYSVQ